MPAVNVSAILDAYTRAFMLVFGHSEATGATRTDDTDTSLFDRLPEDVVAAMRRIDDASERYAALEQSSLVATLCAELTDAVGGGNSRSAELAEALAAHVRGATSLRLGLILARNIVASDASVISLAPSPAEAVIARSSATSPFNLSSIDVELLNHLLAGRPELFFSECYSYNRVPTYCYGIRRVLEQETRDAAIPACRALFMELVAHSPKYNDLLIVVREFLRAKGALPPVEEILASLIEVGSSGSPTWQAAICQLIQTRGYSVSDAIVAIEALRDLLPERTRPAAVEFGYYMVVAFVTGPLHGDSQTAVASRVRLLEDLLVEYRATHDMARRAMIAGGLPRAVSSIGYGMLPEPVYDDLSATFRAGPTPSASENVAFRTAWYSGFTTALIVGSATRSIDDLLFLCDGDQFESDRALISGVVTTSCWNFKNYKLSDDVRASLVALLSRLFGAISVVPGAPGLQADLAVFLGDVPLAVLVLSSIDRQRNVSDRTSAVARLRAFCGVNK
ncbi:MAG: hypothetical protein AB7K09_08115 [Planctomycetota bacterium]